MRTKSKSFNPPLLPAIITLICAIMLLAGCTTPRTMMQNPKTGDTAACGGNTSSSLQGGAIGYHIQKQRDAECVADLEARGYKVEEVQ